MARVEMIHDMTDEQLETNKEYAWQILANNPELTSYVVWVELIDLERQFRVKMEEYREAARTEYTGTPPGR